MEKIMTNLFNLENKVAIVTGGYGHLGTAMTLALSQYGAKVIVAGRSKEKFDDKFSNSSNIYFEKIDINSSVSIKECFANVNLKFGKIDILVNNAHTAKGNSQENMTDEDWAYTLEGVLGSVHKCIREITPYFKKNNFGKIVNISSMYGVVSPDFKMYEGNNCEKYLNPPHYGAAKAAIIQLTNVNAVTPGPFPKEIIQNENPEFIRRLKNKNPLNKIGKPSDIAGAIVLLSSNASDFITGQNVIIDGGWTIW
jgi:gluconate 5-dehydrogenase